MDCLAHFFWAVNMLCLLLAILGFPLKFSLSVIAYELILYVLLLRYSARNYVACEVLGISVSAISLVKILLLSIRCFSILVVQSLSFFLSLLIYSTSSLWFFVHCSRFFQNFSTSFVEERLFDFDRLFSHLPVEFLCKCLKCYSACTISSFFQIF